MTLRPLQAGLEPLGQFDSLDSDLGAWWGGDVAQLTYVSTAPGVDAHAKDIEDGYVGMAVQTRPAATWGLSARVRPLFLADDGTMGYGTLFGATVGSAAGQEVTTNFGSFLGPPTTTGSGKVTLWDKPGLYAVSLWATGLSPIDPTLAGGAPLYATNVGILVSNVLAAFDTVVLARFVEFTDGGSLVNTPARLASAVNSPVGDVSNLLVNQFTDVVIQWHVED